MCEWNRNRSRKPSGSSSTDGAAGIQSSCIFPSGTDTIDIGVVLKNNDADTSVAWVGFAYDDKAAGYVQPGPTSGDSNNSRPDFNDAGFAG